jgi:hypothetical protein
MRVLATRRRRVLLFVALSVSALFVYVPRTCRTVTVMGDSAELVTAAANWGVPHPPGYPLYTLIAHALTRVPAFELPFRVHLSSALFHATTVGVVGSIIELVTGSLFAALVGAATLALGRVFFAGSLYAEVFPLNDLFFACLLWLAIRIGGETPGNRHVDERRADPRWHLPATVLGLSFSHHHMIVLAIPALVLLAGARFWRDIREHPRALFGAALCILAPPIVFYALVPVAAARHPVPSWGNVHDLASLWHLVTREDYGGVAHASRHLVDGQLLERLDAISVATAESFGVAGMLLFLAGLAWGIRRARRTSLALLAAIFCTGPLFASLNAFDLHSEYRLAFFERFTTMEHVPFAVIVGFGAAALARWLAASPRVSPRISRVTMGLVAALAVAPLMGNGASFDLGGNRRGAAYAHDLVDSATDGALVLLKSDMASQAALYACAVEARCGARLMITPGQLWMPWKRDELSRRYPDLLLPPPDVASPARWLVEHNAWHRPVLIHPELVDDVVHGDLSILPSLLLFRVYPSKETLRGDLPRFRSDLGAIVEGRRCEGCSIVKSATPRTAADAQLARTYDAALRAHATAAYQLEWTDAADALARIQK